MSVFVNQLGYLKQGEKRAVLPFECKQFWLVNESGEVCHEGETSFFGYDKASGDQVTVADFSEFNLPGRYRVKAAREWSEEGQETVAVEYSPWFVIGEQAYDKLEHDLLKAYYFLRCGTDLTEEYAGPYVHKACHTGKAQLWEDHATELEATGGWHDAGDYGRYITAGACALAHLLYSYRMYPESFEKGVNIPESGNGVPDVLNECRYELEWFLKMQRADGGVYHKLTTAHHAPFVMPEEDVAQLYVLPVSSVATADFSAVCALAAGIYCNFDEEFSGRLEKAAKKAYQWLKANPEFLGFRNPEGCGTGEYGEWSDFSNRFWAAAEMYSLTGEKKYHEDLEGLLSEGKFPIMALGYAEVGGFGVLAYLLSKQGKSLNLMSRFFGEIVKAAAQRVRISEESGYGVSMLEWEYGWGSNMGVMQHGMIFAIADYFGLGAKVKAAAKTIGLPQRWRRPGEPEIPYEQGPREERGWSMRDHAAAQLDYLLGCNALGISYVTGNGENAYHYPHLRPAHADGIEESMPGMVSGGPNRHRQDQKAKEVIPEGTPAMKCFADEYESYSLNEITIYWNSPAVFTLAYLLSRKREA